MAKKSEIECGSPFHGPWPYVEISNGLLKWKLSYWVETNATQADKYG